MPIANRNCKKVLLKKLRDKKYEIKKVLDKFLKVWYKYAHCKSELQKSSFSKFDTTKYKRKKVLDKF